MKTTIKLITVFFVASCIISCSKAEKKKTSPKPKATVTNTNAKSSHVVIETPEKNIEETASTNEKLLTEKIASGKEIYQRTCFACHQANGEGIPNVFPPLAKSDYLNEDVNRAVDIVLNGKTGEITVNGTTYNSVMVKQEISNSEVADVLTYVYNSWENNKTNVTTAQVNDIKNNL